jgi:putative serine protease PepD
MGSSAESASGEPTAVPPGDRQQPGAEVYTPYGAATAGAYEPGHGYAFQPPGQDTSPYPPSPSYGPGYSLPWGVTAPPRAATRPTGGPVVLAVLALAAALVGGGIGGAIGFHAANTSSGHPTSALAIPITSSKSMARPGSVQQVAAKVLPSVVSIDVSNIPDMGSGLPGLLGLGGGQGAVEGSGSGIVISNDGLILTNNHVAGRGDLSVTFQNGRTVRAKLIEADRATDLAVIQAAGVNDAVPISFGRSADLAVGQEVVAIGSPLGLSGTVTSGIISALHRPLNPQEAGSAGNGDGSVIDGIQTDAAINPGNSGGALVDMSGNLIGITSAIASLGGGLGQTGSIGLGFAIPIDQARTIAAKLAKSEPVTHALLGAAVSSSPDPTQRGALIGKVTTGGPADKAGLRRGDLVIRLDERLIDTADALVAGVRSRQPGDKVTLTYLRGTETKTVDVPLGSDAELVR